MVAIAVVFGVAVGAQLLAGAALATALYVGTISAVGALVLRELAPKPQVASLDPSVRSIQRAAVTPAQWILGRARVGGLLVYRWEDSESETRTVTRQRRVGDGDDAVYEDYTEEITVKTGDNLNLLLCVSEGYCVDLEQIYIDGRPVGEQVVVNLPRHAGGSVPAPSVSGVGSYAGKVSAFLVRGPQRLSALPENFYLQGKTFIWLKLTQPVYSDLAARFWDRIPDVSFLVKGIRIAEAQGLPVVFPEWTENAAALRLWWLRWRRGVPLTAFDAASVNAAVTYCGETIQHVLPAGLEQYSSVGPRYSVNGVIRSGDSVESIESELDYAWQGHAVEVGGVWYFRPGRDFPPSQTIGDDDIIEAEAVRPAPALQERFNACSVALASCADLDFQEFRLPEIVDNFSLSRDGVKRSRDLGTRAFVSRAAAASRLALTALRRGRASGTFVYRVKPGANMVNLGIAPGTRIRLTDSHYGFDQEPVFVSAVAINADWSLSLTLHEMPDGVFSDDLGALPPPPADSLPTAVIPPVDGLALRREVSVRQDAAVSLFVAVEFEASPFQVRFILRGPNGFIASRLVQEGVSVEVPAPGTYTVEAYHVSADQSEVSASASASMVLSVVDLAPPAPVVLTSEVYGSVYQMTCAAVSARDVVGLEVRFSSGPFSGTAALAALTDSNWASASRLDVSAIIPSISGSPVVATAPVPPSGRYRFFCRYVNSLGNYGPISEIGYELFAPPETETAPAPTPGGTPVVLTRTVSAQHWPLWSGRMLNMGVWGADGTFYLIPSRVTNLTTFREWFNSGQTWPLGSPLNGPTYTYFETPVIDLGETVSAFKARINYEALFSSSLQNHTRHDYKWLVASSATGVPSINSSDTRLARTEFKTGGSARYFKFRIFPNSGSQGLIARFSTHIEIP